MEVHSVVTEHLSWGRGILSAAGNPTTEQAGWRGLIDKSPRQQPVRGLLAPSAGHQGVGGGRTENEREVHTHRRVHGVSYHHHRYLPCVVLD